MAVAAMLSTVVIDSACMAFRIRRRGAGVHPRDIRRTTDFGISRPERPCLSSMRIAAWPVPGQPLDMHVGACFCSCAPAHRCPAARRMTLAMTGYPQVYLHGEIDADAARRFRGMLDSGRISFGSDIYLNAAGGDADVGMALGRMFRAAGMATHLGTPRLPKHASVTAKTAVCTDACVYAYLGGLYRWAPSGRDRIGFSTPPTGGAAVPSGVHAYLKDMGIDAAALAAAVTASNVGPAWMTADQMTARNLANNGKLPLTATAQLSTPMPTIELRQVGRKGTHRLTIQCSPGKTIVTAFDEVGVVRARQVAARGARSYFQLGDKPVLDQARDGAVVEGNALV